MNVNSSDIFRHIFIIFSITLFYLFLTSCSYNRNEKKAIVNDSISNTSCNLIIEDLADIRLDYFDSIPNLFKYGGGSVFTYDSVKIDIKNYIFLSNLSGQAVIKIKGHEIYLKSDSSQFTYRKDDYCQEVWIGKGLQIVLKLRVHNGIEDESYVDGVLELKTKKSKTKIKIHGYTET